jgi:hypothetical protein
MGVAAAITVSEGWLELLLPVFWQASKNSRHAAPIFFIQKRFLRKGKNYAKCGQGALWNKFPVMM